MEFWSCLAIVISCLQLCQGSYLGYPRIHFAGQFRADSDTRNNDPCNYDPNIPLNPDSNGDWGFNGTNEIQFFDTEVTSVYYSNGVNSTSDAVVGRGIIGNLDRPFSKLVDLDVDCQDHSTIYGLKFGVRWSDGIPTTAADIAFRGNWTTSVVAQSMWRRLKCYRANHHGPELYQDSFPLGAQSTSRITNITWGDTSKSPALQQLQQQSAAAGGNLTVRISLYYYTRNYPTYVAFNATLGYVVGVIGVPSENDTLNVPGERTMTPTSRVPDITYSNPNDLCHNENLANPEYLPWMNDAPFEVDFDRNEVRFDLSNSIPSDLYNDLRSIGILRLGIYLSSSSCVYLLGYSGIPYSFNDQLDITSGIYNITFDSSLRSQIANNPLVIGQYLQGYNETDTKICGEPSPPSHSIRMLLKEPEFFVRPRDYYVERFEYQYNTYASHSLYVTRFGVPTANAGVLVSRQTTAAPLNGVTPVSFFVRSNSKGIANVSFTLQAVIPYPRQYTQGISCSNGQTYYSLPIDGQVYYFTYCVNSTGTTKVECQNSGFTLVFLAFSQMNYTRPYTWVDDVGPILSQYAHLSKIMDNILNMSNYTAVTQYHNLRLLNLSLSLDFDDPSYMPTTRDLSNVKRKMILEWLANPLYNSTGTKPPVQTAVCNPPATQLSPKVSEVTPRCNASQLPFTEHPSVLDPYYKQIYAIDEDTEFKLRKRGIPGRPLLGRIRKKMEHCKNIKRFRDMPEATCNRPNLVTQLQTAVQLEWATIPTYLTSLYSIVDGCNTEIYELIRSVVMQEMLHFTQSANILIAMGETPIIDDASVTPSYPTHLPGGVLKNLTVYLKKLSLDHVQRNFMAIEVPQDTEVAGNITLPTDILTIGAFYLEISECIDDLGDSIFDPSMLRFQVNWPWDPTNQVGYLVPVINASTAMSGIDMIIAQGEGADLVDPYDIGNHTLAHFFTFEEIVCQHQLEQVGSDTYAYSGSFIPFLAEGVWPMRDNPSKDGILPHTNCYTESRAFHQAYRALLRKLQEVFSGNPQRISEAVASMESLHVHAKKLMWTKYRPSNEADDTTCGPVWDYDWPEV